MATEQKGEGDQLTTSSQAVGFQGKLSGLPTDGESFVKPRTELEVFKRDYVNLLSPNNLQAPSEQFKGFPHLVKSLYHLPTKPPSRKAIKGGELWRQSSRKQILTPEKREMFGRVRAASSTLDSLEQERAPPKLIKDDSLSIYEATLMKLKLGSQRNLEIESGRASADVPKSCGDALSSPCHDQMMMDNDCSSATSLSSYSDCQSTASLKRHESRNVSVLYLFSKYKSSGQAKEEVMIMEDDSSVSVSPSCSECQSLGSSTGRELEQDGFSFFPVCQR